MTTWEVALKVYFAYISLNNITDSNFEDKAYMALVKDQSFNLGRDTIISPPVNVHESITNGSIDLADSGQVYYDGRIWLNWDFSEPAVLGLSQ